MTNRLFALLAALCAAFLWAASASAQTTLFGPQSFSGHIAGNNYSILMSVTTTGNSLGYISVTFQAGPNAALNLADAYYCIATGFNATDCTTAPTQLKFGGSNSVTIPQGGSTASDFVPFAASGTIVVVCIDTATSGGADMGQQIGLAANIASVYSTPPVCSLTTRGVGAGTQGILYAVGQIRTKATLGGAIHTRPLIGAGS